MGFDIGSLFGGGSGGGGLLGGIEQEIGQLLGSGQSQQTCQTGAANQSSQAGFNILDPAGILNMLGKFMGGMNGSQSPDACQNPATTEMPPQTQCSCQGYANTAHASGLQPTAYPECNDPSNPSFNMMGSSSSAATGSYGSGARGQISQTAQSALAGLDQQIAADKSSDLSNPDNLEKLKEDTEKRQEMFSMLSDIDKCFHDMCMTAINNMR